MLVKSNRFAFVIEKEDKLNNKIISFEEITSYFNDLFNRGACTFYAIILHDKDFNADGEIKRPHYHIVFEMSSPKGDQTIAKDMAKVLLININVISYACALNFCGAIRYLTHLDNADKYQYSKSDLITSSEGEYQMFVNQMDFLDLDISSLLNIIKSSKSLTDVYQTIGIGNATKYRWLIKDLLGEIPLNRKES